MSWLVVLEPCEAGLREGICDGALFPPVGRVTAEFKSSAVRRAWTRLFVMLDFILDKSGIVGCTTLVCGRGGGRTRLEHRRFLWCSVCHMDGRTDGGRWRREATENPL